MFIVRRKSDNVALYLLDTPMRVAITERGLLAGKFRALDINNTDHELVETNTGPSRPFIGGELTFDGTTWAVVDENNYLLRLPVPEKVTRLQARRALIAEGLWSSVETAVTSMSEGLQKEYTKAFFYDADNWERNDTTLLGLAAVLTLTEEQVDMLFKKASLL